LSQNKKGLREERLIKRVRHAFKAICAGASVPYGADAAANRYFYKPASAPTLREAALLAAVLPNPGMVAGEADALHRRACRDHSRGHAGDGGAERE